MDIQQLCVITESEKTINDYTSKTIREVKMINMQHKDKQLTRLMWETLNFKERV